MQNTSKPAIDLTRPVGHYIGGTWVHPEGEEVITVDDSATRETVGQVLSASRETVQSAIDAARACVASGALTDMRPSARAALMFETARLLREVVKEGGQILCLESGKPLADAEGEFEESARYFEYYGGMTDKLEGRSIPLGPDYIDYTVLEPYGVSAQIVPWNFPVSLTARSLSCALAAGNAVIVKSPELDPLANAIFVDVLERAGWPVGAFNLINGYGHTAGAYLVENKGVDQIVFTGSVPTGQAILTAAARNITPCVMELGGKSAGIVFEDADLDTVLDSVRTGIYFNAGQVCSALSRLLVHRSVYDTVVERVAEMARALKVGPGIDGADLTPLISEKQRDRVAGMCAQAIEDGARLVTGGQAHADLPGYFFEPTVFADVPPQSTLGQEEAFGPVLSIMPFDNEAQAIEIANGTDYGLVAGLFTKDLSRAHRVAPKLDAGQVFVNEWFAGGVETPFGGVRRSGYGREKGQEAMLNYLRTKNIAVRL